MHVKFAKQIREKKYFFDELHLLHPVQTYFGDIHRLYDASTEVQFHSSF